MIRSIRHRGLKKLFEQDDPTGVNPEHLDKLRDILATLHARRGRCPYGHAQVSASSPERTVEGLLGGQGTRQLAGDIPF